MKNILFIPEQKTPYFLLPSLTITWEQDLSHLKRTLSFNDLNTFLKLHTAAQENPHKVKKDLEAFHKKYPNHPEVLNLLGYVYLSIRKKKKGEKCIKENYEKNHNYLFARINYADLCLRKNQLKKIPEIFNKTWNLPDLYPEKTMFHVSEFRGFMVLMGLYHLAIGKWETAEGYYYLAKRIDPNHPNTTILEKKLYHRPFYKKLFGYKSSK